MIIFTKNRTTYFQKFLKIIGLFTFCFGILLSFSFVFSDNKLLAIQIVRKSVTEINYLLFGNSNHSVSSVGDLMKHARGSWRGIITPSNFPTIDLQIDYKNIAKLEATKYSTNRPYVNANLVVNDDVKKNTLKSKVRYKGDRGIHIENFSKSSFRVNLKGDHRFQGLEEFSIQSPIIRNYSWELLIRDIFSTEGLLTLNSHVVNFSVNGDDRGLFFVEEVPSTRTLERQSRKAGPIFGLDEDLGFGINSNLDVYDAKSWKNSALYEYAEKQLYKQFLSMEQDLSIDTEIFDIESWARYFALTDIFGSYHGSLPKSVKFYFNPVSAKFEPLLFDAHLGGENLENFTFIDLITRGESTECDWICPYESFYKAFLNDKEFFDTYISFLNEYSTSDYIEKVFNWYKNNYESLDNEFYSYFMASDGLFHRNINLYLFKFDNVYKNVNLVRQRLATLEMRSQFLFNKEPENIQKQDLELSDSSVSVVKLKNFILKSTLWKFTEPTLLLLTGDNDLSGLSADEPLVIVGPIMIVQQGGKINIKDVEIRDGQNHKITNRNWSGVLNIFSSNTTIQNLRIIDTMAEDAINIVSSDFFIDGLNIVNARSDAIDLDFADGAITNLSCYMIGNDCFDVSESVVEVETMIAQAVKDKGISAGENSKVKVASATLQNAGIGLVSKDGSELLVDNLTISDTQLHLSTFVKKAEYNDPTLQVDEIIGDGNITALKSFGSRLIVDEKVKVTVLKSSEIEAKMYGVDYGVATQK